MKEILKGAELERELAGRSSLSGTIKLRERKSNVKAVIDDFEIEGVLHAGSTCICYRAVRFFENGMEESGILKEFYPVDSKNFQESFHLERFDIDCAELSKQLYSNKSTINNFIRARNEFTRCYEKIDALIKKDEKNKSFFSPIRIYRGIADKKEKENYTVYIWSPADSLIKSFDDHLLQMHKRIEDELNNPQQENINLFLSYELHTVLQTMRALAVGVERLHMNSLLHLDIKPSNFGIKNLGVNDGNNISVTLFDVNSIDSALSAYENPKTTGTPFFRAPELVKDPNCKEELDGASILSDVFSLGCTLYNAIILNEGERGLYECQNFDKIGLFLRQSLFMRSEYNSKSQLSDALEKLLKRSLARYESDFRDGIENYLSVSGFIKDIEEADKILEKQIVLAREAGSDKTAKIELISKEDYYSEKTDGGATSGIQCLLYDKPLYDYIDENGRLDVLVLGAGVYSQKFIDIAFELSQIKNCYIDITVITNEKQKDESRYLGSRPEFLKYFRVGDEEPECDDLGKISFLNIEKGRFSKKHNNAEIAKKVLEGREKRFSYVFISLADDVLNKKVARDLENCFELFKEKAIINFITYYEGPLQKDENKESDGKILVNPVAVKNTLTNHKDYKLLTRMAFNCHLLWGNGVNIDLAKTYGEFRAAYTYTSSFAHALSIKYKLKSLGLNFDSVTEEQNSGKIEELLSEITQAYIKLIGTDQNQTEAQKETVKELTLFEHRRWLVNMICSQSYRGMTEEDIEKLKDSNKDHRNRKHSCVASSNIRSSLSEGVWKSFEKWDEPDLEKTEDFQNLDSLDKISVLLHRRFMKLAEINKNNRMESEIAAIRGLLSGETEALALFNAYLISMRAVSSQKARNENAISNHRHTRESFLKYLKAQNLLHSKKIKKLIKDIEDNFLAIKMAYEYTDYKAKDELLVKNIPFIINYSTSLKLCVPFVKRREKNEWFSNVASSLVINPRSVTYLVDADEETMAFVKEALSNVTKVMDSHSLQTKITLIIYMKLKNSQSEIKKGEIEKELKEVSERIISVDTVEVKNQKDLVKRLRNTFETNKNSSARFDAVEINDEFISGTIYSIDDFSIPTFEFDSINKKFTTEDNEKGYIWFSGIPFNVHLNIEDMFAAQGRLSIFYEPELQKDYESIWNNCYYCEKGGDTKKTAAWKALCNLLGTYAQENRSIVSFDLKNNTDEAAWEEETKVFAPIFCKDTLKKIFACLKDGKNHLISQSSDISEHNSSTLKLCFSASKKTKEKIMLLLKNPYLLSDSSKIEAVSVNEGKKLQIYFNSLIIESLSWQKIEAFVKSKKQEYLFKTLKRIFEYLVKEGYLIVSRAENPEEFDLSFSSYQIKDLLINEGRLLELYIYYKTLAEGYFDEVKTSLEIQKKRNDNEEYFSTQEFDMVTIKGMRTQLIEVKAQKKLEQGFYQKLDSNGRKFGINSELTLIADFGNYLNEERIAENQEIIDRGEEDYKVRTVCKAEDIKNIGRVLKNIEN